VRARGFTLVEVMVALAIVAITLPALLMALYQQVDNAGYLRDKAQAEMVALNKLAEMRLVAASTRNVQAGKDNGDSEFAGRDWYWWADVTATESGKIFRVDIRVALDEQRREQPLYMLTASMFGDLVVDPDGLQGPGGDPSDGSQDGGAGDTAGSGANTSPDVSPGLDPGAIPDGQ
jgi:general secretion pathway protein I